MRTIHITGLLMGLFLFTTVQGQALDKVLLARSKKGTFEEIKKLVENGADVNAYNQDGSVLIYAVANHNYQIVKYLIDHGADVNYRSEKLSMTPLHAVVRWGKDPAIVKLLIDNRANVDAEISWLGETPLFYAIEYNPNIEIVNMLIEAGADINHKASGKNRPVHWTARNNEPEIAELLINRGAKFDDYIGILSSDYSGCTPLLIASIIGFQDMVKVLIDAGADINAGRKGISSNPTPLYYAVEENNDEVVNLLLKANAEINIEIAGKLLAKALSNNYPPELKNQVLSKYLVMPNFDKLFMDVINEWHADSVDQFSFATRYGNIELMKYLVSKGISFNKRSVVPIGDNVTGGSPLCVAVGLQDMDKTKYLIEELNMDVNEREYSPSSSADGWTPFIFAAVNDDIKMAEYLQIMGADITKTDGIYRSNPIIWAGYNNSVETVKWLIEKGLDVNSVNKDGESVLMGTCLKGNAQIVKILVENGARINHQASNNLTPLHYAIVSGDYNTVAHLLLKGAKINDIEFKNPEGDKRDLFYFSVYHNKNIDILKLLAKNGLKTSTRSKGYSTPLEQAVYVGDLDLVKYLVEQLKQSVNEVNSENKTNTLLIASWSKEDVADIVDYLLLKDVNVNYVGKDGITALMNFCSSGDLEIAKKLINAGAGINYKDADNLNALVYAINTESVNNDLIEFLLNNGADVNFKYSDGSTLLHSASAKCSKYICQLLINKGLGVNDINKDGYTPLHYAAGWGNTENCKFLVSQEGKTNTKNNKGQTPLMVAKNNNHTKTVAYFESLMAPAQTGSGQYWDIYLNNFTDGNVEFILKFPNGSSQVVKAYLGTTAKKVNVPHGTLVFGPKGYLGKVDLGGGMYTVE